MNGHFLVGLANRGLAERLVSEGLEVPFRKRAVRITVGNLSFFVGDSAVISALAPFGRVTSIAPKLMKAGPYTYNDGRREAFIVLHEGMAIERLPTRLDITIKGEAWPAYLSSGIRCSRSRGQGHRRANCPLLAGRTTVPGPATPTSPTSLPPVTAPGLPQQPSAQPPAPAPSNPAMEIPGASHAARAVTPSAAPRPSTPAAPALPVEEAPPAPPPVAPAPSLRAPGGSVGPQSTKLKPPAQDIEMTAIEESSASSTSSSRKSTRYDPVAFIRRSPAVSFAGTDALDLGREEVLDLLSSKTRAQRHGPLLTPLQSSLGAIDVTLPNGARALMTAESPTKKERFPTVILTALLRNGTSRPSLTRRSARPLAGLIGQLLGLRPGGNSNIYKVLHQVKAELKTGPAAVLPTPPLPAPQPAEPTPPAPHGEETKPAMATPPPPLPTSMEEDQWGTLGPTAPTLHVEMAVVEETTTSSTSSLRQTTRSDLADFLERNPEVSFTETKGLGLKREEVMDLLSSKNKVQKRRLPLTPAQKDALAGLADRLLDLRPGNTSNIYKVLSQVKSELNNRPSTVTPTPPLPENMNREYEDARDSHRGNRIAAPTLPLPVPTTHGVRSAPAPHSSQPTEDRLTHRQICGILQQLNDETLLSPIYKCDTTREEIVSAIIHDFDRDYLVWRLSPENKIILADFLNSIREHLGDRNSIICRGKLSLEAINLVWADSPFNAEEIPARYGLIPETSAELSAENQLQIENSIEMQESASNANLPTSERYAKSAVSHEFAATLPSSGALPSRQNWAEISEDQGPVSGDDFTVVQNKRKRRNTGAPGVTAAQSNGAGSATGRRRSSPTWVRQVQEIRTTRAHIVEARARQASCNEEQCLYLEYCPDYQTYQYLKAIDRVVGGSKNVVQFAKVNGHYLLGLTSRSLAERLIREGLEVEGTLIRTCPFRKRSIKITIGNPPFFVEDAAVINALSRFGRITSIAPKLLRAGEFDFTDGRREAFILLHDGVTVDKLPTRFEIKIKGEAWPAYLTYGIKCSRCHGQGHRRANCPLLHGQSTTSRRAPPLSPIKLQPLTAPGLPKRFSAAPAPAPPSSAVEDSGASPAARAVTPSTAPRPSPPAAPTLPMEEASPAPPPVTPAPSLRAPVSHVPAAPTPDVELSIIEEISTSSTSSTKTSTREGLVTFIERNPGISFAQTDALGLGREEVLDILSSKTKARKRGPLLSPSQGGALAGLIHQLLGQRPGGDSNIYKVLRQVRPYRSAFNTPTACASAFWAYAAYFPQRRTDACCDDTSAARPDGDGGGQSDDGKRALCTPTACASAADPGADGFTIVRNKRRRRESPSRAVQQRSSAARATGSTSAIPRRRPPVGRTPLVQESKATRTDIAEARARQIRSTDDNCVYVELCPDFEPVHYLRTVDELVGGPQHILQLLRMNGHVLVGLSTKAQADRLIERGLVIEGTYLRAFPFRKRAEKLTISNLPFFVEDATIIEAFKPYGKVTSIALIRLRVERYSYTDGRREALILLYDGVSLQNLPTRLDITSKGNTFPTFLAFGIKFSRCGRQGHRLANCPIHLNRPTNTSQPHSSSHPPSASSSVPGQPAPAAAAPGPHPSPVGSPTEASADPRPPASQPTEAAPQAQPAPVAPPDPLPAQETLEPTTAPLDIEMTVVEETTTSSTSSLRRTTRSDLADFLERNPEVSFTETKGLGLKREEVKTELNNRPSTVTPTPPLPANMTREYEDARDAHRGNRIAAPPLLLPVPTTYGLRSAPAHPAPSLEMPSDSPTTHTVPQPAGPAPLTPHKEESPSNTSASTTCPDGGGSDGG
ncbi:hypothetical protein LAZ67_20001564, partial [Cordylochernes scorpioides]